MAGDAQGNARWLLGREEATLDEKGRVLFSKKKRDILGEDFIMCLGDRGCVDVYPLDEWDKMVARVMDQDRSVEARDIFTREVLGNAYNDLNFDPQGRAVVPRSLREEAKLQSELVLIGCGDRVEIWAVEELAKQKLNPKNYGRDRFEVVNEARVLLRAERWGGYDHLPG